MMFNVIHSISYNYFVSFWVHCFTISLQNIFQFKIEVVKKEKKNKKDRKQLDRSKLSSEANTPSFLLHARHNYHFSLSSSCVIYLLFLSERYLA